MSKGEEITISRRVESPSISLAQMLKSQYVSKDFQDIFSATELAPHEIIGTAGIFSTRFVTMVLATDTWMLEKVTGEEKKKIEERLMVKKMILSDPNAMAFVLQDVYLYALGLCRQSMKRQSRHEAVEIAKSPRTPNEPAEDLGTRDKLFTRLGISRKYKNTPVER